jgi:restriction system protein
MMRRELEEEKDALTRELFDALAILIFKHGKALHRKMRQATYTDDYGNEIRDKFVSHRDYFIDKVMCRDMPRDMWDFFSPNYGYDARLTVFGTIFQQYINRVMDDLEVQSADVTKMSPLEYERHCAGLMQRAGWVVNVTKATADQCVNIVAQAGLTRLVLQCKLYSKPVGNSAVQEVVAGKQFERAEFAIVASNAGFTSAARALATVSDVILLHHTELLEVHKRLNIPMDGKGGRPNDNDNRWPAAEILMPHDRSCRPINEIIQQATILRDQIAFEEPPEVAVDDVLFSQAFAVVLKSRNSGISNLQRHLMISFSRAARLLEQMEGAGLVSPIQLDGTRLIIEPKIAKATMPSERVDEAKVDRMSDGFDPYASQRHMRGPKSHLAAAINQNIHDYPFMRLVWAIILMVLFVGSFILSVMR